MSVAPRAGRLLVVTGVSALLAAGCGSGDRLSAEAAEQLQADVAAVAQEVEDGDGAGALKALEALRAEVSTQLAAGGISGDRARTVLQAADEVAEEATAQAAAEKAAAQKAAADKAAADKAAAERAAADKADAERQSRERDRGGKKDKDDDD